MSAKALQLKDEGNKHFLAGDYVGAEALYSKAIIADPRNPALYTNRAFTRLRLFLWDSVVADCEACLAIAPDNMKAIYYLSNAQLSLNDYDAALKNAQQAREICTATADKSLPATTSQVLRCRKARWDDRERRRVRSDAGLERETMEMMEREKERELSEEDSEDGKREIDQEWAAKEARLQQIFEMSRSDADKRRDVPSWAIDDITFDILVDPVVTKSGKSYERASILEHLRRHQTDPLTREPLTPDDLRPNLDLRIACEAFLEENGWAADW